MRMDIAIAVDLPAMTGEQQTEFIESVMAVFRATFPEAAPLEPRSMDVPPPVTVTIHAEDDKHGN